MVHLTENKSLVCFSGDSIVLWKQGERVLSAGPIQVRKDARMSLVEAASLRIKQVDVADAGWLNSSAQISASLFLIFRTVGLKNEV